MLKMIGFKLDLISNIDMLQFIRKKYETRSNLYSTSIVKQAIYIYEML